MNLLHLSVFFCFFFHFLGAVLLAQLNQSQRRLKQFLHIFEKQQAATDFNLLRKLNENIYIFYSQKRTETILGNTVYMCEKFDTDIFSAHDFFQKVDFHIAIYCVPLPLFL